MATNRLNNGFGNGAAIATSTRTSVGSDAAASAVAATSDQHLVVDLSRLDQIGVSLSLTAPLALLSLGTSATYIQQRIIDWLKREVGGEVPRSVAYLMVDGAPRQTGIDSLHFKNITSDAAGESGGGTDPNTGELTFRENYPRLRKALNGAFKRIDPTDSRLPAEKSIREAVDFVLLAGAGSISGGSLPAAIELCHDVARQWQVRKPRVHVKLLGAEMALRDVDRTPSRKQQLVVRHTQAENLTQLLAWHHSSELITFSPPGGTSFARPACDLTYSRSLIDQSNGLHDYATYEDYIEGVSRGLAASLFTAVGKDVEERCIDLQKLGTTGHGTLA